MATLTAHTALDTSNGLHMATYDLDSWATQTSTYFHVVSKNSIYRGIYEGQGFTYAPYDSWIRPEGFRLLGGTIDTYTESIVGTTHYTLKNMSFDASLLFIADREKTLFQSDDTFNGSKDSDILYSWAGDDILKGNGGNDILMAGRGNDSLIGGSGKDKMSGAGGRDIFDFNGASESGLTTTTRDIIADFIRGQDKIDLSGIDANTGSGGNNAFTNLIGPQAAFTAAGQLKLVNGILYGNTDGDAAAEFSIQLTGISTLSLADFIL